VTRPLGTNPALARLVAHRFRSAALPSGPAMRVICRQRTLTPARLDLW
jgi:hypothetical protein